MTILNTCVKCNKLLIQFLTKNLRSKLQHQATSVRATAPSNVCPKLQLQVTMNRRIEIKWLETASHNYTSLTISICMAIGSPNINADETSAISVQHSNKRKFDTCTCGISSDIGNHLIRSWKEVDQMVSPKW